MSTEKQLAEALVSLADAAELLHKKKGIIQPFLEIYKEHGETIEYARYLLDKKTT